MNWWNSTVRLLLALALPSALLVCCGLLLRNAGAATNPTTGPQGRAPNPHWKADGCNQCHAIKDDQVQPVDAAKVDAMCLQCHNGHAASAEVHPIGKLARKGMTFPDKWPVNQGRLGCITCHDVKIACDTQATRSARTRTMLRSVKQRFEQTPFCLSCHTKEEFPRLNPHMMLTADHQPVEASCLTCHSQMPDRNASTRSGDPALRAKLVLLCRSCHPKHNDVFSPGHFGQKIKPDMLAFMKAREVVGLTRTPGKGLLEQFKNDPRPTRLKSDFEGRLTCTTCHNPHLEGLFPKKSELAYRAMRIVGDRTTSPVHGENWCNHCHDLN